jgi:type IV pilus assembly protein PilM
MPLREAWGLDIGQTAIRAVRLRHVSASEAEISDVWFHELGTRADDPDYEEKVLEALKRFTQEKKTGNQPFAVSLPGFTTLFRDSPLPAVSSSRLTEIVSYEAKQLIPYPLDEVVWDYHKLREDEESGEIGIALVACRRDIVDGLLSILDEAGINAEILQVGPIALANYIQFDQPPEGTALLLDAGARSTDFVILNEGGFWLRSIGISGAEVTKTLMQRLSIPFEEAEALKARSRNSKQADRVFSVVEPVLRNLTGEIQRSLGYYKSLFRGVRVEEAVVAGRSLLLPGASKLIADSLGVPAHVLRRPQSLRISPQLDTQEIETHRHVLGTAAGLALQGLGLAQVDMTLLPRERRVRKIIQSKFKYAAAILAVLLLTVLAEWYASGSQAAQYEGLVRSVEQVQQQVSGRRSEYQSVTRQFGPAEAQTRAFANISPVRGYLLGMQAAFDETLNDAEARLRGQVRERYWERRFNEERQEAFRATRALLTQNPELREELEEQVRQRIEFLKNRDKRILVDTMSVEVVEGRFATREGEGGGEYLAAITGDLREDTGRRRRDQQEADLRPVVRIGFSGRIITRERADTVAVKDALEAVPGIVKRQDGSPYLDWNIIRSEVTSVGAPAVTTPRPPREISLKEQPDLHEIMREQRFLGAEEQQIGVSGTLVLMPESFRPEVEPLGEIPAVPWQADPLALVRDTEIPGAWRRRVEARMPETERGRTGR